MAPERLSMRKVREVLHLNHRYRQAANFRSCADSRHAETIVVGSVDRHPE